MTKQIYVNIAWAILCIALWFSLAVAILYFNRTIDDVRSSKETNREILSILKNPVSCWELPYGIQDKIEQMSYTLSDDTTCSPNK